MKNYWEKALTFDEYMQSAEQRLNHPKNEEETNKKPYYELGIQRMNRTLKTFKIDESQAETLANKNFDGKILIISEAWCGDASATVPAVAKFFEGKNEVKIFLRDDDTSLIDQFLTNGTQSIPIIILLDKDYNVINHWGPRPKYGLELLKKFKENPETYPRETFYNDLQVYYARNRGKDAIEEILDLI
ncbi:MAG: thioredoxin family protein [Cruoricaptor ignavus]|nr:thioredoxin family protein [Cruoricaptor ignavus]